MFRMGASRLGIITTVGIALFAQRASCASRVSEHESHLNEENAVLSEGHHSIRALGQAFDGIFRVMTEGKAGFAVETIPEITNAELELGNLKCRAGAR